MKTRSFLISLIVGVLLFSLFSASLSHADAGNINLFGPTISTYYGNVTIEPDGSIIGTGFGSIPIIQSGDSYTFTGQINGTLTIFHNGSIVNGNNYTVKPFIYTPIGLCAVNIVNVSHVKLTNLNVSGTHAWYGIYLNNTSHDFLDHISESYSYDVGFEVLNYTHDVNISDSMAYQSYITAFLGGYFSAYGSLYPVSSKTSSNDTLYNFTANNSLAGIVVGGDYMKVIDSTAINAENAFFSIANNSLFSGNHINVSDTYLGFAIGTQAGVGSFHNVSFDNNMVFGTLTTSTSNSAIAIDNSTGTISGNIFNINAMGYQIKAIAIYNSTYSISGNSINLTDIGGGSSNPSVGIGFLGNNYTITKNQISISGNYAIGIGLPFNPPPSGMLTSYDKVTGNNLKLNVIGGTGVLLNGSNSVVSHNVIAMNSTGSSITGIGINGFNDLIESNAVNMSFYNSGPVYSAGIGNISGLTPNSGNIIVEGNSISFAFTSMPLVKENSYSGIGYLDTGANNISIIGNTVTSPINATLLLNGPVGIFASIHSGLQVSQNTIHTPGGIFALANNTVISQNNVNFSNPGIGFGGNTATVSNETVLDNSLYSAYSNYGVIGVKFNNATITGNYFYANGDNIGLESTSNVTVYHNDFYNQSAVILDIQNPATVQNLLMNSSYPIGGNYYAGLAISDKYSGPSQNAIGSDGINDTPYTLPATSNLDHYPLAKPWLRPQFTIHETGLINGAQWQATFNGQTKISDTNTISFNIVNATYQDYSYSYASVEGYVGSGTGTYQYSGSNSTSVNAVYVPTYTVNFTESGLPSGVAWQITINGTIENITTSYYEVVASNGTSVSYAEHNNTLYYTTTAPGQIIVKKDTKISISFYHYAYLKGSVLPSGANVNLNGAAISLSNGNFNVTLAGGNYEIVVSENGYVTYYKNVTLTPGQALDLNFSLKRASSNVNSPSLYEYIGIGAAAVAIIAVVSFIITRRGGKP